MKKSLNPATRQNLVESLARSYRGVGWLTNLLIRARLTILPLDQLLEGVQPGGRALDLGCGIGLVSRAAALRWPGCRVVGLDLDYRRLQIALQNSDEQVATRTAFVCGSVQQLPLAGQFSVIFCVDIFHHIPYRWQEELLDALPALLQPQGELWIKEIDVQPRWKYCFNFLHDTLYNRSRPHCRSHQEWQAQLDRIGFESQVKRLDAGLPYPHILLLGRRRDASRPPTNTPAL